MTTEQHRKRVMETSVGAENWNCIPEIKLLMFTNWIALVSEASSGWLGCWSRLQNAAGAGYQNQKWCQIPHCPGKVHYQWHVNHKVWGAGGTPSTSHYCCMSPDFLSTLEQAPANLLTRLIAAQGGWPPWSVIFSLSEPYCIHTSNAYRSTKKQLSLQWPKKALTPLQQLPEYFPWKISSLPKASSYFHVCALGGGHHQQPQWVESKSSKITAYHYYIHWEGLLMNKTIYYMLLDTTYWNKMLVAWKLLQLHSLFHPDILTKLCPCPREAPDVSWLALDTAQAPRPCRSNAS